MKRRRVQASRIWDHGDEYKKTNREEEGASWICDHCDRVLSLARCQSTGNILRHLREEHRVTPPTPINRREDVPRGTPAESTISYASSTSQPERSSSSILSFTHRVDIIEFRNLLIRWIVQQQVPYFAVDQQEFRDLLYYLAPGLKDILSTSHTTIGRWIKAEYQAAKQSIKELLVKSLSKIHLSFDLWTSPSGLPILGLCAHYLDQSLELRHPLLALKYMKGSHTGEAIANVIAAVVVEYEIADKLGVYVSDNATNNDVACRVLIRVFHEGERESSRRSRCLGHIINLAAQAFIYGRDNEAFIVKVEETEAASFDDLAVAAENQRIWRKRGAFGKLHNIAKWVKASPQRGQRLSEMIQVVMMRTGELRFMVL